MKRQQAEFYFYIAVPAGNGANERSGDLPQCRLDNRKHGILDGSLRFDQILTLPVTDRHIHLNGPAKHAQNHGQVRTILLFYGAGFRDIETFGHELPGQI